jgi:hypothetical protein
LGSTGICEIILMPGPFYGPKLPAAESFGSGRSAVFGFLVFWIVLFHPVSLICGFDWL